MDYKFGERKRSGGNKNFRGFGKSLKNNKPSKKLIVFTAYATFGILGIYFTTFQYTILNITRFFLPDITMMGVLISVQGLGMCISPLILGALSEKVGKRKVVLISYLLIIAGTLAAGTTSYLAFFIAAVFLTGAGFSVMEATLCSVLADEFPKIAVRHLNFSQVVFSLGALAGPVIAEILINSGVFFKDLYSFCAVAFMLMGVAFFFTKQENDTVRKEKSAAPSIISLLKSKVFLLLMVCIFIYVGMESTVANFSGSYFELILEAPELSAAALSLFWGAMIPSRFLAGILKIDTKKIFIISGCIVFAAVIGAILLPWNTVKIVMFAMCGFGCGPLWPLLMNKAAKKSAGSSSLAMNVMMMSGSTGGMLFPLFSGMLANLTSQVEVYYLCAFAAVIMLLIYLRAAKEDNIKKLL